MSNIMSESTQNNLITKNDVIRWLRDNPSFLQDHPEVCDLLMPPVEQRGKDIADFQSYMIQRLKDDKEGVIEATREIVETSRANMSNQSRIHKSVLMVLEAQSFDDFIRVLTMDFLSLLDVDIVSLVVEADGEAIPHIGMTGVKAVTPGMVNLLMEDRSIILGPVLEELTEIYGGGAGLVKSHMLMRMKIDRDLPEALLAFGSREPGMFQSDHGTEMAAFLGKVIERAFRIWLRE
jgi:uncharacterized protein YigA (DUF484 family)